jgi:UDP-N-acetylmuramoylalanine--D-glutamate ligase
MNRVVVVGAGKSGVAAARFLAGRGVSVAITDAQPESSLPLARSLPDNVTRIFGSHPAEMLDGIDYVVLSPGVPTDLPFLTTAAARGIPVISEIELAFRQLKGRVLAITGSNGKSTTTVLTGEILKEGGLEPIVAGNIGDPLVASVDPQPRNYVIELSSFQLETVDTFRPDIALLLNITPDHMDRYASMEEYTAAKLRIFANQGVDDLAIVNAEDPRTVEPPTRARVWRFSSRRPMDPGGYFDGQDLIVSVEGRKSRISRSTLRLEGSPNVENALASWLAARAMGVDDAAVERAFRSFEGLPHRMRLVRELAGVRYINDSKGTNVDATIKSLEGMEDGRVLLILGGKDKKGEFERLRDLVSRKARKVLTIGAAAERIGGALRGSTEIIACGDLAGAIAYAATSAEAGDVVLLSPACASFDQYRNFEERGRHFEELVRKL